MSYQVSSVFLQKFSPREIHELKSVFKEHDRDYAAAVPLAELHTVLLKVGENVTPNQTTAMAQQVRLARRDQVSFQEFLGLLYDFRNGIISLDPAQLMEQASLAPAPTPTPTPEPVPAPAVVPTPEPAPSAVSTPLFPGRKASGWQKPVAPESPAAAAAQPSPFARKAQWPPSNGSSTDTPAPAPASPAVSKPQWSSAGTGTQSSPSQAAPSWGRLPTTPKPEPEAAVPHVKPQWPPTGSSPANAPASAAASAASPSAPKPQWPPAGGKSSPSAPMPQRPPTGGKPSPSAPKTQWPPSGSSPKMTKAQWPPSSKEAPAPRVRTSSAPQWPLSAAPPAPTTPVSPATPKRAQWPSAASSPSSLSPAPAVAVSSPRSPVRLAAPIQDAAISSPSVNAVANAMNVIQRRASVAATSNANAKIHEVKGTAGGVHSYSEEETVAFTEHINNCLNADKDVAPVLPINTNAGLFSAVCDGVVLCKLINAAVPETIDERALNTLKSKQLNVYQKTENQNLCINAAKSIGCSVVNIGPDDLIEGKPILVLGLVWQIIKIQLTSTINLKHHPELMRLLLEGETLEEFMKLPPDQILLRWMNYHLKSAGHPKQVTNFSTDVQDAVAYSVLLHHIAPQHCDLCHESTPEDRAAHVIQNARRLEVETFIKPRDITSGNPKLNMSFVAQLFNTCPALDIIEEEIKQLEEILYDDTGDTREERVFRMWINSLAIEDVYINHLYSDLHDGMTLLKVLDKIHKGIVAWNKVNMVAPNKFKKVENCNYCVVLGKQLKFSLVNVGGADIFEGAKKMILSIVWQAMRYQQLKILGELSEGRSEITDKDIIAWANQKVGKGGQVKGNIVSFRDPSLCDGLFLLDLVHAVEPRAVNWDMVSQEKTDEAKASNAKYAISCAQKIGASVFLTYEDIVEVKPKMMMTYAASLWLVDMHHSA